MHYVKHPFAPKAAGVSVRACPIRVGKLSVGEVLGGEERVQNCCTCLFQGPGVDSCVNAASDKSLAQKNP